uniref:DUF4094 domain-containing protein n=1 Tax=Oryza nivara TaxID=4536 RepID=A0A0E0FWH1_ORYNI
MILRTPPQRKRRADSDVDAAAATATTRSPVSDRRLVLYDRPTALVPAGVPGEPMDDMVCTYHCRQMVKSEFMVALDTAEKQVQEYRATLDDMEERLSKSEDERATCQDKLNYVEQELAATKGRESAMQERLLKEVGDFQERYCDQIKKIGELETQLKKEIDSRIAAESSSASAKESVKELEGNLQRLSENSEREKKALKKELSYLQDDTKLSISKLNAELERMRLRAQNSEDEAKLLNEQLEDLKKQLDEEKEVDEARRLKSSHTNVELLKEKILEEQGRRERAEMELSKLQEIEAKAQKLELELASCTALLSNIPDVSSFGDIPQKIADLQKQALTNLNKVGEVTSQLKELKVALEFADLSKQRAEGEATLAKERAESATREIKRLELLLAAISEERDRLRKDHAVSKSRDGDDASSKLGHGDYSASSTKVLRMVNTLAVDNEAKQTIEALQAELKKTKERLQAVEELKGQADVGTVVDVNIAEKLAQLKNQIATLEKREESDDEKLEFDYESGSTNIVVNDYTSQHEIAQQTLSTSERQPQPEKKPPRTRPPLPGKAVAALCVASFVVGLLLSGRVAVPLLPPGSSSPASNYKTSFSTGCENKRAKLGESNPTDIMNEVSRTHHAIQ